MKIFTENKKAYHNYEILETFEAGLVLRGAEIKAIRAGKINISGAHAKVLQAQNGSKSHSTSYMRHTTSPELFLINANIQIPDQENATRTRKLLMHRSEINKLIGKTQQKGLTLIPLKIYIKNGRAKLALGLGRGKKLYDKREDIKKKDLVRQKQRGMEY